MTAFAVNQRAKALHANVVKLLRATAHEEAALQTKIDATLRRHQRSATNLAHYLALRHEDIHRLQLDLASVGLSSLGKSEGHVRDTLLRLCAWLAGQSGEALAPDGEVLDREEATAILHANTHALFGPRPANRHVYIMLTAPDAAEVTPDWADGVLNAGADLLRINGAHGSPAEWKSIASTFKARAALLDRPGRVIVNLPGPKLRADVLRVESTAVHFPRSKDRLGRTVRPTPVLLVTNYRGGTEMQIPIPPQWLARLEVGDVLELTDSADRRRRLFIEKPCEDGVRATCNQSLYITSDRPLIWRRGRRVLAEGRVGNLPPDSAELRLAVGDVFFLGARDRSMDKGVPALAFSEPALLEQVRPGERVILDDGKLSAVVETASPDGLLCRVRKALKSPVRLRSGKGVSFPDSELAAGHLGPQDETALAFALESADGVGVSFVNTERDVACVGERIKAAGKPDFGMLLKLETRSAMSNLAGILFEALKYHPVGLMIARGDLAVELSFERLAEMQEEILWFGEACHLPVVWATQVLDSVAHSGVATRAEITDAAMSMRAECVMLNKGPHIADATRMLADIIHKMEAHQYKKRSLYRKLTLAGVCNGAG